MLIRLQRDVQPHRRRLRRSSPSGRALIRHHGDRREPDIEHWVDNPGRLSKQVTLTVAGGSEPQDSEHGPRVACRNNVLPKRCYGHSSQFEIAQSKRDPNDGEAEK